MYYSIAYAENHEYSSQLLIAVSALLDSCIPQRSRHFHKPTSCTENASSDPRFIWYRITMDLLTPNDKNTIAMPHTSNHMNCKTAPHPISFRNVALTNPHPRLIQHSILLFSSLPLLCTLSVPLYPRLLRRLFRYERFVPQIALQW